MSKKNLLLGGDISEISYVEECGGRYYTEDGTQKDPLEIMAANGMNIARIRNYNHPGKGRGWTDPNTGITYYRRANSGDLKDNLKLMKRAKACGMQIEFSFHYSDYWTNDYTQIIPEAWQLELDKIVENETSVSKNEKYENKTHVSKNEEYENGTGETNVSKNEDIENKLVAKLEQLVYEYTRDSLLQMKGQSTIPEYISLGNEIQSGILFPYGHCSHFANLARFLNAGAKAVREIAPESKIITHLDDACNKFKYGIFFGNCRDHKVDYDIIGTSYYPFWTGKNVAQLVDFMNDLVNEFDRDIMIMETGFNFAPTLPSGEKGQLADCGPYEGVYEATPEGQKKFMEELIDGMRSVKKERCIGDLYWDPIMVEQVGVGWAVIDRSVESDTINDPRDIANVLCSIPNISGSILFNKKEIAVNHEKVKDCSGITTECGDEVTTNIVSNTTLFDFDHKALPAMSVWKVANNINRK